tara:strand:+ start:4743 stop:5387 length:645 start_codon:yes stop_codon:yes gene_type:complete
MLTKWKNDMRKKGPGASKGENRFKKYHEEKIANTSKEVRKVLSLLQKSNVGFSSVTKLANYVARIIGNERGKPMSHTTLIRTPQYRYILDQYMENNFTSTKSVSRVTEAFHKEIKEVNLEEENARLRQFIQANLGYSSENEQKIEPRKRIDKIEKEDSSNEYKLCDLIKVLVDNSEGVYEIKNGIIFTNLLDREIAEDELQKPFTKWYKERYPH